MILNRSTSRKLRSGLPEGDWYRRHPVVVYCTYVRSTLILDEIVPTSRARQNALERQAEDIVEGLIRSPFSYGH